MATTINVKDIGELEDIMDKKDIRIAEAFNSIIFKNINSKKRYHHALSIIIEDEDNTYDITIDKNDFEHILSNNLKIFIGAERYEECDKIKKAIAQLDNK